MKIIFATDRRFLDGLEVTIASLMATTQGTHNLDFVVLHSSLSRHHITSINNHCKKHGIPESGITFINIDSYDFSGVRTIRGSKMTYARMLIPELFPDECEVIYCDCDILFLKGLDEVVELPTDDKLLAAAPDMTVSIVANDCPWDDVDEEMRKQPHFNCGLIKINLDLWRDTDLGNRAIHIARTEPEKCRYWDQSVLNYLCMGKVGFFSQGSNFQMRGDTLMPNDRNVNIHYVGAKKPWMVYSNMESYRLWRRAYRDNVSVIPHYALKPSFWFFSTVVFFGKKAGIRNHIHKIRRRVLGW